MDTETERFDNLFYQHGKYHKQEESDMLWNNLIKINEKIEKKASIEREE